MLRKNRVYRAFKELQEVGGGLLLPIPPLQSKEDLRQLPYINHDIISNGSVEKRANLSNIEMQDKEELRKIQKPFKAKVKKIVLSKHPFDKNDFDPITMGGEDQNDAEARKRRDKVKEVMIRYQL